MSKNLIAPSILAADFARLGEEVAAVLQAGADLIHVDIMDNHYVPNLTFGPAVCNALRQYGIKAPIDVHLMSTPIDELIISFAKAGATYISFHPDATANPTKSIDLIHQHGCQAGIALNPDITLSCLTKLGSKVDLVLLMSVKPGFGGQQFLPEILPKIKEARTIIDHLPHQPLLEVDGGINLHNLKQIAQAGPDIFVAGSAIFNYPGTYPEIIAQMKKIIQAK